VSQPDTAGAQIARTRRNRLMLLGLFAIAFLPMLGAHLLYLNYRGAEPWSTTNNGELLEPPLPVAALLLRDPVGMPAPGEVPAWRLMLVADDRCSDDCEQALFMLRQLHVLLHRDAGRVERAIVYRPALPDAERWQTLAAEHAELATFTTRDGALRDGIYVIDPRGNLVLFYHYEHAGKPVLEDLKRLLKASRIG
jgi:hypothetical protein